MSTKINGVNRKVKTSRKTLDALRDIARREEMAERAFLSERHQQFRKEFSQYMGEDNRQNEYYMGVK